MNDTSLRADARITCPFTCDGVVKKYVMLVPSAAASRLRVEMDGSVLPRSTSLITDDEISARSANALMENPCSVRRVRRRAPIECPYCHSLNTVMRSEFGATACKAILYCNGCRQPFELFKAF